MARVCLVLNSALLAHSHRSWRRCFKLAPRSLALLVALSEVEILSLPLALPYAVTDCSRCPLAVRCAARCQPICRVCCHCHNKKIVENIYYFQNVQNFNLSEILQYSRLIKPKKGAEATIDKNINTIKGKRNMKHLH